MKQILVVLILVLVSFSCNDSGTDPGDRPFNLSLKYGVSARNELDTFTDTFTKDLVLDGTVRTKLILSPAELDSLEARFLSINIFTYPDNFVAQHGDSVGVMTPHTTYILKLSRDQRQKVLYWEDAMISADPRATELRSVFDFVRTLVEGKAEYQGLPPARGGYL
jgi:hypothetical protein